MKQFFAGPLSDNARNLLRRMGYGEQRTRAGQISYVKRIAGDSDTDPFTIPATSTVLTMNWDPNANLLEEIDALVAALARRPGATEDPRRLRRSGPGRPGAPSRAGARPAPSGAA